MTKKDKDENKKRELSPNALQIRRERNRRNSQNCRDKDKDKRKKLELEVIIQEQQIQEILKSYPQEKDNIMKILRDTRENVTNATPNSGTAHFRASMVFATVECREQTASSYKIESKTPRYDSINGNSQWSTNPPANRFPNTNLVNRGVDPNFHENAFLGYNPQSTQFNFRGPNQALEFSPIDNHLNSATLQVSSRNITNVYNYCDIESHSNHLYRNSMGDLSLHYSQHESTHEAISEGSSSAGSTFNTLLAQYDLFQEMAVHAEDNSHNTTPFGHHQEIPAHTVYSSHSTTPSGQHQEIPVHAVYSSHNTTPFGHGHNMTPLGPHKEIPAHTVYSSHNMTHNDPQVYLESSRSDDNKKSRIASHDTSSNRTSSACKGKSETDARGRELSIRSDSSKGIQSDSSQTRTSSDLPLVPSKMNHQRDDINSLYWSCNIRLECELDGFIIDDNLGEFDCRNTFEEVNFDSCHLTESSVPEGSNPLSHHNGATNCPNELNIRQARPSHLPRNNENTPTNISSDTTLPRHSDDSKKSRIASHDSSSNRTSSTRKRKPVSDARGRGLSIRSDSSKGIQSDSSQTRTSGGLPLVPSKMNHQHDDINSSDLSYNSQQGCADDGNNSFGVVFDASGSTNTLVKDNVDCSHLTESSVPEGSNPLSHHNGATNCPNELSIGQARPDHLPRNNENIPTNILSNTTLPRHSDDSKKSRIASHDSSSNRTSSARKRKPVSGARGRGLSIRSDSSKGVQ